MKAFMIIKDPKVAKLFADKTRREILHNLRQREMTACQLARALNKNVSSISYHLSTLEKAGLIEQTRTVVKGNLVEKYYRATAQRFIISYTLSEGLVPGSEDISKWNKEICKIAAENLKLFGFKISEEKRARIQRLIEKYASLRSMALEHAISRQNYSAQIIAPAMNLLFSLLRDISLFQNPEYLKLMEEVCKEIGIGEGGRS